MFLHKMHVEIVTQPGVTQTPKKCLEFTFFRDDQENNFYLQNRKIDWVFYSSGMTKSNPPRDHSMFLHKMHVEIVTQPGVTQTPKNCIEFTFFRDDQENKFYLQNRKIDWVFYSSGMTWLARKLDSGRPQWTSSERSNVRFHKCQQLREVWSLLSIYIFLKLDLLDINFLIWVVWCILYKEIAGKKTD